MVSRIDTFAAVSIDRTSRNAHRPARETSTLSFPRNRVPVREAARGNRLIEPAIMDLGNAASLINRGPFYRLIVAFHGAGKSTPTSPPLCFPRAQHGLSPFLARTDNFQRIWKNRGFNENSITREVLSSTLLRTILNHAELAHTSD